MSTFRQPLPIKLDDEKSERVRRSHAECIAELQKLPSSSIETLEGISLVDGVATPIAHRLGRKPRMIWTSPPQNATSTGRIEEIRSGSFDRTQVIVLKATDWGATILIDAAVM